ncbi:uncharacterized protein LOC115452668 [Manduca sexta]|uniref:Uncharacterized protein n=1 Tax=Manduca sexta TaxID=7130 RepID=A0A922CZM3_MANSE|nr:uncharacterized protein LOC115452668 [Manduca sexta]KAG6463896.1 hypothetical protein O3G_MSEX014136 [Manduca sexta]
MEKLLTSQRTIMRAMRKLKNIIDNGIIKSIKEYYDLKLKLEKYWRKFKNNDTKLSNYDIRDKCYYTNKNYVRTRALYKKLKKSIVYQEKKLLQTKCSREHLNSQPELIQQSSDEATSGSAVSNNYQRAESDQESTDDSSEQHFMKENAQRYHQNSSSMSVPDPREPVRRSKPVPYHAVLYTPRQRTDPRLAPDLEGERARVHRLRSRRVIPGVLPSTTVIARPRGTADTQSAPGEADS